MEKQDYSPLSKLMSEGDVTPVPEDDDSLPLLLDFSSNKTISLTFDRSLTKKKRRNKSHDFIGLTDQLHSWNKYLNQKFGKISY